MKPMYIVKLVSGKTNTPLSRISAKMGKSDSYVSVAISKDRDPSACVLSKMLDACGYGLYAMPKDDAPEGAIPVTDNIDWAYINGEYE